MLNYREKTSFTKYFYQLDLISPYSIFNRDDPENDGVSGIGMLGFFHEYNNVGFLSGKNSNLLIESQYFEK